MTLLAIKITPSDFLNPSGSPIQRKDKKMIFGFNMHFYMTLNHWFDTVVLLRRYYSADRLLLEEYFTDVDALFSTLPRFCQHKCVHISRAERTERTEKAIIAVWDSNLILLLEEVFEGEYLRFVNIINYSLPPCGISSRFCVSEGRVTANQRVPDSEGLLSLSLSPRTL